MTTIVPTDSRRWQGLARGRGAQQRGGGEDRQADQEDVYTLLEAGWGSTQTIGLGAVAIGLIAAFVVRQDRVANPLMPLRLFRSRIVAGANIVMALLVVGFFGMFFLGALCMQGILGYDPLQVGLAFLPSCSVSALRSGSPAEAHASVEPEPEPEPVYG